MVRNSFGNCATFWKTECLLQQAICLKTLQICCIRWCSVISIENSAQVLTIWKTPTTTIKNENTNSWTLHVLMLKTQKKTQKETRGRSWKTLSSGPNACAPVPTLREQAGRPHLVVYLCAALRDSSVVGCGHVEIGGSCRAPPREVAALCTCVVFVILPFWSWSSSRWIGPLWLMFSK